MAEIKKKVMIFLECLKKSGMLLKYIGSKKLTVTTKNVPTVFPYSISAVYSQ